MDRLEQTIAGIAPLDQRVMKEIREHQDNLTKPPGSLGMLEKIAVQIGGITGQKEPSVHKKAVVVMAADHGVVDRGVSAYPREVTGQMLLNFAAGGAAINVLARHAGAEIIVVDVGAACPVEHPKVISRRIRFGTGDMTEGPAMTETEARRAIDAGIEVALGLASEGCQLLATGEMGIGNSTASSAMMACFLGLPPGKTVGRGAGLDREGILRKERAVSLALSLNKPNPARPLDVVAKVGGLEIAALTGLILGAAYRRIPVVVDGFISTIAALTAVRMAPVSGEYLIASHCSAEKAHRTLLHYMRLRPLLELRMRLGEGTGAVMAFHLIEAALKINKEMSTFESAGVARKSG